MTSPFSDELITAYLDGELTDDERADVEKQMREDSELRSLCDDLQKLRHTLQAVPVVEPSAGLAQRVLRQAERRMLLGDDSAGHEPVRRPGDSDRSHPTGSSKATLNNWNWRLTATAIGSVAALLLVAMFLFSPLYKSPSVGNVALAPESDRSGALQSQGRPLAETAEELSDSEAELAADAYARSPTDGASTAPATARPEAAGERLDEAEIGQLMEPVELSRSRPSAVPRQRSAGRKAIAAGDDLSAVPRYNLGEADETAPYGAAGNGALGGGAERKGTAKEDTAKRDTAKRKTTDHYGGFGYDTELAPGRETGDYAAPPVSRMETDDHPGIAGSMQYGERPEAKGQSYELAAPTTAEALRRGSQPRSSQWRQLARGWDGKDGRYWFRSACLTVSRRQPHYHRRTRTSNCDCWKKREKVFRPAHASGHLRSRPPQRHLKLNLATNFVDRSQM